MLRSLGCQPVQFTLWESRLQPLINSMLAAQALAAARQAAGKLQASWQVAEKSYKTSLCSANWRYLSQIRLRSSVALG